MASEKMNFVLQTPSLQHLAGVKVVGALWNQRHILSLIERMTNEADIKKYWDVEDWTRIVRRVTQNAGTLPLPRACQQQLEAFVTPMGEEVESWCIYHGYYGVSDYILARVIPRQFCWTMLGSVDFMKTAELIVADETVDAEKRYELACVNCLEDEARHLLQHHISEERRWQLVNEPRFDWGSPNQNLLVTYFTCTLSGRLDLFHRYFAIYYDAVDIMVDSIPECLFKVLLGWGARGMREYFFGKLNPEEKEKVLNESRAILFFTNGVYFVWRMNAEQQERMFRESTAELLRGLLEWPMQPLFLEAAKRGWRYMTKLSCAGTLHHVFQNIRRGNMDYDYRYAFWQCWELTPADYKRHFLAKVDHLRMLLDCEEGEFARLVFDEAPPPQLLALSHRSQANRSIHQRLTESHILGTVLRDSQRRALMNNAANGDDTETRLRINYLSRLVKLVIRGQNDVAAGV